MMTESEPGSMSIKAALIMATLANAGSTLNFQDIIRQAETICNHPINPRSAHKILYRELASQISISGFNPKKPTDAAGLVTGDITIIEDPSHPIMPHNFRADWANVRDPGPPISPGQQRQSKPIFPKPDRS